MIFDMIKVLRTFQSLQEFIAIFNMGCNVWYFRVENI